MTRVSRGGRAAFSKGGDPVSIKLAAFRGASILWRGGAHTKTTAGYRHATFPLELGNLVTKTTPRRSEGGIARRGYRRRRRRVIRLLKSGYTLLQIAR
jgi:hypothetical protein